MLTKRFQELKRQLPSGIATVKQPADLLFFQIRADDLRVNEIIKITKAFGLSVLYDRNQIVKDNEFNVHPNITYESNDITSAKWLNASPNCEIAEAAVETHTPLKITLNTSPGELDEVEPSTRIKFFNGNLLIAETLNYDIVSQEFKLAWERSGLNGLRFIDAFTPTGTNRHEVSQKYWIIWPTNKFTLASTDDELEQLALQTVIDAKLAQHVAKYVSRIVLSRSCLDIPCGCDVATTNYDKGGIEVPGLLIGSKNFYNFCNQIGAEINWEPVAISPTE